MGDLGPLSGWRRALPRIGLDERSELPLRHLAALLTSAGERFAAADAHREIVRGSPADVEALESLARVLGRLGRDEEQLATLLRIAEIACDRLGVAEDDREAVIAFELASHGAAEAPGAAPPAFVTATFDAAADRFDHELRTSLDYRGPEHVLARVGRVFSPEGRLDISDVGCGTGLLGPLLRPFARTLQGVDLSPRMLEKARALGVYDRLVTGELTAHLRREPAAFDVVVAADVFVYIGDVGPAFAAIHGALRAGGSFYFTVELSDSEGDSLSRSGRYSHSEASLRRAASAAGLTVVSLEQEVLRRERGTPVQGLIVALRKPSSGDRPSL